MQFDLNQFNISRSLTVSSMITMALHLGVAQSLVETIHFLVTVEDAQIEVDGHIPVDALEVGSTLKQVRQNSVELPHLMGIMVQRVVEYMHGRSGMSFSGSTSFKNNSVVWGGGGIFAWDNSGVSFSGSTSLKENSASYFGGGILAWDSSSVSFNGSTSFKENSAVKDGGGIYSWCSSEVSFSSSTSFKKNSASRGGGISAEDNSDVSLSGTAWYI